MFKRSVGLAPHQYLIGKRIERARALLTETSDCPLQILPLRQDLLTKVILLNDETIYRAYSLP